MSEGPLLEAPANTADRLITLGASLPSLPERLLLAHARGQVLFVAGAGVSQPSGLPNFQKLTLGVFEKLDLPAHNVISKETKQAMRTLAGAGSGLQPAQIAYCRRYLSGEYDIALGMLERKQDGSTSARRKVREAVLDQLEHEGLRSAQLHRTLMRLADRGGNLSIVTTNFDLLLERAVRPKPSTYSLGAIPRPSRGPDFDGIFHIHGAIEKGGKRPSELVLSDQDFGEYYLRRRMIPDFIYEAARLYNIVLIGYSANDPPMRYLLNAVAADGARFEDLKERFVFIGREAEDAAELEDWRARGITPIVYNSANHHHELGELLQEWANLFASKPKSGTLDKLLGRIVRSPRSKATDAERDLFDHIFRRSNSFERARLSRFISERRAHPDWLSAAINVTMEASQ